MAPSHRPHGRFPARLAPYRSHRAVLRRSRPGPALPCFPARQQNRPPRKAARRRACRPARMRADPSRPDPVGPSRRAGPTAVLRDGCPPAGRAAAVADQGAHRAAARHRRGLTDSAPLRRPSVYRVGRHRARRGRRQLTAEDGVAGPLSSCRRLCRHPSCSTGDSANPVGTDHRLRVGKSRNLPPRRAAVDGMSAGWGRGARDGSSASVNQRNGMGLGLHLIRLLSRLVT